MADTYTVTVPMTIERQTCEDILDTALYAQWGWWGDCRKTSGGTYSIAELDDDGSVLDWHGFTLSDIAQAIGKVMAATAHMRGDLARQVATAVTDDPDIDADASDCILQLAVFGELRYG